MYTDDVITAKKCIVNQYTRHFFKRDTQSHFEYNSHECFCLQNGAKNILLHTATVVHWLESLCPVTQNIGLKCLCRDLYKHFFS